MYSQLYLLEAVGIKCADNDLADTNFKYNSENYKRICSSNEFQCLLEQHSNVVQFQLHQLTDYKEDGELYVGIFFVPTANAVSCTSIHETNLIKRYFNFDIPLPSDRRIVDPPNEDQSFRNYRDFRNYEDASDDEMPPDQETNIALLYSMLREAHTDDVFHSKVPKNVQHKILLPELRPYQENAVKWMVHRELTTDYFPTEYISGHCPSVPDVEFFIHPQNWHIADKHPGNIKIPTGGILADEMGLGKTIETLALIVNHRKKKRKLFEMTLDETMVPTNTVKCICPISRTVQGETICCHICGFLQHKECVFKLGENNILNYVCPSCWSTQNIVESSATLIVSPSSIKSQWLNEIVKHIAQCGLRVHSYDGIKSGPWISPLQLSGYDLVITDYSVLRSEIYYTQSNQPSHRSLRTERTFQHPVSPLPLINWWRVCLDEAQMVESPSNMCAKMVKLLPAVHRWSVTGTPIEKSIDNLFGLFFFMDCKPYTEFNMWQKLSSSFPSEPNRLVDVLKKVMWRTCKSSVIEQITIPPQTEIVHKVQLTDVEVLFYKEQLETCAKAFWEKAKKVQQDLAMSNINQKVLKALLEPLRKMRQNCSSPAIFVKTLEKIGRRMLSPDDLLQYLIHENDTESRSDLRTIASSANGLAGLCLLNKEKETAVMHYTTVLHYADLYKGNIRVDDLLQIHALHNLIEIRGIGPGTTSDLDACVTYIEKKDVLEWKFINKHYSVVTAVADRFEVENRNVKRLEDGIKKTFCWRKILEKAATESLMEKIRLEMADNYGDNEKCWQDRHGLDLQLTKWSNEFQKERKIIFKIYKPLKILTTEIEPPSKMSPSTTDKVDAIVQAAFDCHFDVNPKVKTPKALCELCKMRNSLSKYETFIFDKKLKVDVQNQGSWKPTKFERAIKIMVTTVKKERRNLVDEAVKFLEYLDAVRKEFKELSKLWMEINHLVSAFDELNMCKMRLRIKYDSTKPHGERQNSLFINRYEIPIVEESFRMEKLEAIKDLERKQGTIKYLRHMAQHKQQLSPCPICVVLPEDKYSVFECGHHVCNTCLIRLRKVSKHSREGMKCPVCRSRLENQRIYKVNCSPAKSTVCPIKGEYSSKIKEIVETVLMLRNQEPDIKIVVFSQWNQILNAIGDAFDKNCITFVNQGHKGVDKFKYSDITCILLQLSQGCKGLNLIEATHVFLVEPIINSADELQAIGRIHRIGQTKPTFVHRFIVNNSVEEKIFNAVSSDDKGIWRTNQYTVKQLEELFKYDDASKADDE